MIIEYKYHKVKVYNFSFQKYNINVKFIRNDIRINSIVLPTYNIKINYNIIQDVLIKWLTYTVSNINIIDDNDYFTKTDEGLDKKQFFTPINRAKTPYPLYKCDSCKKNGWCSYQHWYEKNKLCKCTIHKK